MSAAPQRKQLPRTIIGIAGSDALLAALQSAHRQIHAAFAQLECVSSDFHPNAQRLDSARLRIAQANLVCRRLVNQICGHLTSVLSADERDKVRELRRQEESCSQKMSAFVRHWTPDAITQDWDGYRFASREIRTGIASVVRTEKDLLYPLLTRNR